MIDGEKVVKDVFWYRYGDRIKCVRMYEHVGGGSSIEVSNPTESLWADDVDPETGDWKEGHNPFQKAPPDDDKIGRFRQSIQRARSMLEQYAYCNPWTYFVTLTLSPEKGDRGDLATFKAHFKRLCSDVKRATGESVSFVIVPELHADCKSWHMHALMNIPDKELTQITSVERVPVSGPVAERPPLGGRLAAGGHGVAHGGRGTPCGGGSTPPPPPSGGTATGPPMRYKYVDQTGHEIGRDNAVRFYCDVPVYRWDRYERNFGWCLIERIEEAHGAAIYVTKTLNYLSKGVKDNINDNNDNKAAKVPAAYEVLEAGKHLYYVSRGLKKREKIAPEDATDAVRGLSVKRYDYEHCLIEWYS